MSLGHRLPNADTNVLVYDLQMDDPRQLHPLPPARIDLQLGWHEINGCTARQLYQRNAPGQWFRKRGWTDSDWENWLASANVRTFAAVDPARSPVGLRPTAEDIVGFVQFSVPSSGVIEGHYGSVRPEYRHNGVFGALMSGALTDLWRSGPRPVRFTTSEHDDPRAVLAYAALGFDIDSHWERRTLNKAEAPAFGPEWSTSGPPLIVFDCDGVLLDTDSVVAAILSSACEGQLAKPVSETALREWMRGRHHDAVLERLAELHGAALPASFAKQVETEFLAVCDAGLPACPGAREFLTSNRLPVAVVSNSSPELLDQKLRGAGFLPFFPARWRVGVAPPIRPKPAPDVLLHLAGRVGRSARHFIVVEDSTIGVAAARAAGATTIGYADNSVGAAALEAAGAAHVIRDLGELAEALTRLGVDSAGRSASIAADAGAQTGPLPVG